MQRLWFKAKQYGWGWYPVTWQGWLVTALFVGVLLWSAFTSFDARSETVTEAQLFRFIGIDVLATVFLVLIAWRTGEPAKWRWGNK